MVNKRRRSSLRWRGRSSAERRWTCSTSLSLALASSSAIEAACAAGLAGEVGAVLRRLQAESESASASVLVVASRSSATAAFRITRQAASATGHAPPVASDSTRPPGAARQLALGRGVGPRSQHQRARGSMDTPPVPGGASSGGHVRVGPVSWRTPLESRFSCPHDQNAQRLLGQTRVARAYQRGAHAHRPLNRTGT